LEFVVLPSLLERGGAGRLVISDLPQMLTEYNCMRKVKKLMKRENLRLKNIEKVKNHFSTWD